MTQSSWFEQHLALKTASNHDDFTFTDTHCHLDFPEFSTIRDTLLNACHKQGIKRLIVPSVAPDNWQKVLDLCSGSLLTDAEQRIKPSNSATQGSMSKNSMPPNSIGQGLISRRAMKLLPALGIHPWYLQTLSDESLEQLDDIVKLNRLHIVAIGETGLDGTIAEQQDNLKKQQYFFDHQISLAQKYQLPMIIHHRKSHPITVQMLKAKPLAYGGIIHGFSGSYQQAKAYLDAGLLLGIGGTMTYERAKKTINTIKRLPLTSIVLETDAPAMPLQGHQGQPNSPLMAKVVFDALCLLRDEEPAQIALQLEENVNLLLGC